MLLPDSSRQFRSLRFPAAYLRHLVAIILGLVLFVFPVSLVPRVQARPLDASGAYPSGSSGAVIQSDAPVQSGGVSIPATAVVMAWPVGTVSGGLANRPAALIPSRDGYDDGPGCWKRRWSARSGRTRVTRRLRLAR